MPNININTTHTVTCEDAPVEDVYRELDEKFPQLNPIIEQKLKLREERDDARKSNQTMLTLNDALKLKVVELTRERDEWAKSADFIECEYNTKRDELVQTRRETEQERALKEALVAKVDDLTSERDELQRKLEGAGVLNDRLKDITRPALPEGIRLAEHPEYGRVVVSPKAFENGDYMIFYLEKGNLTQSECGFVAADTLTFLDSEPAPTVLTAAEDFDNAPVGTIVKRVAELGRDVAVKDDLSWSVSDGDHGWTSSLMAQAGPWTVVEWGQE